ncbi:hypothetical protein GVAV_001020, partial [Gurleya vavrai]
VGTKKKEFDTTLIEDPRPDDIRQIFDCFDSNGDGSDNFITLYSSTNSEGVVISTNPKLDQTKITTQPNPNVIDQINRERHHFGHLLLKKNPKGDLKNLVLRDEKGLSKVLFKKPRIDLRKKPLQNKTYNSKYRDYKKKQCLCKFLERNCKNENFEINDRNCIKYQKTQFLYNIFYNDQELLQKLLNKKIQNLYCLTDNDQIILFMKFMYIFDEIHKIHEVEKKFGICF